MQSEKMIYADKKLAGTILGKLRKRIRMTCGASWSAFK